MSRRGVFSEGDAWVLLLGCSFALVVWFAVRFRRSPVEELA